MSRFTLTSRQREQLRRQLEETEEVRVYRRTVAVLEYDRGTPITHIAEALGVDRRSVHRWIEAYGETRDPDALHDDERSGRPCLWTEEHDRWVDELLATSPEELGYFAVNWTIPLLQQQLEEETGEWFSEATVRRSLRRLDYVWKRPRYRLEADPQKEKKTADSAADPGFAA